MTREEIIKLAREAGFVHSNPHSEVIVRHSNGSWQSIEERLDQFAKLVAAAEHERIAAEFDRRAVYSDGTPLYWYKPHEPAEIVRSMK